MLEHLKALTWHFRAQDRLIWAIAPYAEPARRKDGTVYYRPRRAAESGTEGWACVDDAARAALLALQIAEQSMASTRLPEYDRQPSRQEALDWARRWMSLVRYMQLS